MPKGIPNKKYSGEYKQMVVETMLREKMSYTEAEQHFGISGHECIPRWERIYLEEGAEGLHVERRGRKSTGCLPKLDKQVGEDLIAEVQRLRAENVYLKNLQALVLENERKAQKKRK